MSIKSYTTKAIGALATAAALMGCAPSPDEKESKAIFSSFFDKGTPQQAVGRYIPFGPNDSKGAIYVNSLITQDDGAKICLQYTSVSAKTDVYDLSGLMYCRPSKEIQTGAAAAAPTSHP